MTLNNSKHVGYLDGWRGLAILFLLTGHFFPVIKIDMGLVGVNLFFVLSGYLMCGLLFVKEVPIPQFYKRRIARIFPAYAVFLGAVVVFYLVTDRQVNWSEAVGALALVNYPAWIGGKNAMPFGHTWSLSIEEHSYILLSLIALLIRVRGGGAHWTLLALSCITPALYAVSWRMGWGSRPGLGTWVPSETMAFGVFISGTLMLWLRRHAIPRLSSLAYPVMFLGAVLLHWWSIPGPVQMVAGVGLFALCLNSLASAPDLIKNLLSWYPLRMMGIWSYSIYLWQQPFYLAQAEGAMEKYTALTASLVCALLSYYLVETPAREWLNANWRDRATRRWLSRAAGKA